MPGRRGEGQTRFDSQQGSHPKLCNGEALPEPLLDMWTHDFFQARRELQVGGDDVLLMMPLQECWGVGQIFESNLMSFKRRVVGVPPPSVRQPRLTQSASPNPARGPRTPPLNKVSKAILHQQLCQQSP